MRVWIWWKKLTDSSFDAAAAEKQMNDSFAEDKQDRTKKPMQTARIKSETDAKLDKIQNEKDAALQEIEKDALQGTFNQRLNLMQASLVLLNMLRMASAV